MSFCGIVGNFAFANELLVRAAGPCGPAIEELAIRRDCDRPCQAGVLVSSLPLSLTTIFGLPLDHQPVRFPRQRQDNCIGLLPA